MFYGFYDLYIENIKKFQNGFERAQEERQKLYPEPQNKVVLSIREAAAYSSIGINTIERLLKEPGCPFVLYVGTKRLVKCIPFEKYLMEHRAI